MSLHAYVAAHQNGFDENMFLESGSRTYVEETGGANFFFVTKGGELVIPKSGSILPSITRRSMVYVAENYLDLKVTQRPVALAELPDFVECGLCGTGGRQGLFGFGTGFCRLRRRVVKVVVVIVLRTHTGNSHRSECDCHCIQSGDSFHEEYIVLFIFSVKQAFNIRHNG